MGIPTAGSTEQEWSNPDKDQARALQQTKIEWSRTESGTGREPYLDFRVIHDDRQESHYLHTNAGPSATCTRIASAVWKINHVQSSAPAPWRRLA